MYNKVPSTSAIIKYWNGFSLVYSQHMEANTQPILYSLISNLRIKNVNSIFEAGCGSGSSIPLVCSLKSKECKYIVSDFSEQMISRAIRRTELMEEDYQSCLSLSDDKLSIYNGSILNKDFPKSNIYFKHLDNENLDQLEENSVDRYFSNLTLQIVENPEKMLSEAYRVIKSKGRAGFSVWGKKENSKFFTIIPEVFKNNGIVTSESRSNFHLNERETLIKMLEKAGFVNILCWYQFFPFGFRTEEEFNLLIDTPTNRALFENLEEEKKLKIKKECLDKFMSHINNNEPVGLDALIIIGEKE